MRKIREILRLRCEAGLSQRAVTRALGVSPDHKAGEKLFVDWAGERLPYSDAGSGKERRAALFVAVLGCSNYTYAEAFADHGELPARPRARPGVPGRRP